MSAVCACGMYASVRHAHSNILRYLLESQGAAGGACVVMKLHGRGASARVLARRIIEWRVDAARERRVKRSP